MKVYLAGCSWEKLWGDVGFFDFFRLESFFYISEHEKPMIRKYRSFLLDSGAFTFMNDKKNAYGINWDDYVEKYARFINEYNISLFFELDIDSVVGIKEVERLRDKLEYLTNKKCIPVWHKSRGLEYYKQMCKNYDYIAIGGIITREIKRVEYPIFSNLLKIAKENNTKVHGLGLTNMEAIKTYKFYSVDSTTWLSGNKFGKIYVFENNKINIIEKPENTRIKTIKAAENNFKEWIKFQKYAEKYL
jgi:hypothetical protein